MNDLPNRKSNRLKGFNYSSPGAYFITICTEKRRNLLSVIDTHSTLDNPRTILTDIGKIVEKYILSTNNINHVFVDKYVIMPNHIHLILIIEPAENIYEIGNIVSGTSKAPSHTNHTIPHIVSVLKRFCNKEIGYNIFQRSFYDHIIRNRDEYNMIARYIQENTARWQFDCFFKE